MANKKVSELPSITSLSNDDKVLINHLNSTGTVNYGTIVTNITGLVDSQLTTKIDSQLTTKLATTNYIPKPTGGILGDSLILNSSGQWVPKSTASMISQTTINQGVVVAKGFFKTVDSLTDTTPDTSKYLPVRFSRLQGSTIVVVDYSGLDSKYKSTTNPFFINGQYVGVDTVTGKMTGHLYVIKQHNPTACTFVIETRASEAKTEMNDTLGNLSLIVNNVDDNVLDAFNIKSIHRDVTSPAKYYVNFKQDLYTGSKTNASPTKILSMMIIGQGYADPVNIMTPYMMYDSGRENYIWSNDVGEGFGANSMGVHIGFFYTYNNGANTLRIANAIFSCIV